MGTTENGNGNGNTNNGFVCITHCGNWQTATQTTNENVDYNGDFLSEERHYQALLNAKDKFVTSLSMVNQAPLDMVSIDIKDGWDYLGEISGKTATEEIINDIFSRFCVGK